MIEGRRCTVRPLELQSSEAALSVMSVARAGDDLFQTTVADDKVLLLDQKTLETLPHVIVKLATLLVREQAVLCRNRRIGEADSNGAA